MKIHYLQHVPFEGPGCIADWTAARGHTLKATRFFKGDPLPRMADVDWLVVMGGPMGIYDEEEYPWLVAEKTFIREAIQAGKIVLGICLGAQLIADVLGGPVTKNLVREIGWFPLKLTKAAASQLLLAGFSSEMDAFHWHGDTFALPPGSTLLASSAACVNQAFVYDSRVVGFQFHLDMRFDDAQNLVANCQDEIGSGPYMQSPAEILADTARFEKTNRTLFTILDRMAPS
jgi:GMP synthase-like glutamine amidotransferase